MQSDSLSTGDMVYPFFHQIFINLTDVH